MKISHLLIGTATSLFMACCIVGGSLPMMAYGNTFCTVNGNYQICTDKDDYAPGETVRVIGNGFVTGTALKIKVTRPDGSVVTGDGSFAPWPTAYDTVDIGSEGRFQYDYVLDGIEGKYLIQALDEDGTVLATHTFTDARTINWVTLNGGTQWTPPSPSSNGQPVSVTPGDSITVVISVTTTGTGADARWRATSWRIATSTGTMTCVNHPNHDGAGTYTETFNITAPTTPGTYNAYFIAYSDSGCSSGVSSTLVLSNAVVVSCSTVKVQLGIILDGTSSVSANNFTAQKNGLADAINGSSANIPHDGTVELTVVQMGTYSSGGITYGSRLDIAPVVITASNYTTVASRVSAITQIPATAYTPVACAIYLLADTMSGSPCSDPTRKQVLNIITDGLPNYCCPASGSTNNNNTADNCPGGCDFYAGCDQSKRSAEAARNYAINLLGMTANQDEFDVEGFNSGGSYGDFTGAIAWFSDNITYPQPGHLYTGTGSWPAPGWVYHIYTTSPTSPTPDTSIRTNFRIAVGHKACIVPNCTITAAPSVCANSTGNTASVTPVNGAIYAWTISSGSTITAGAGTNQITYTAAASGNVTLGITITKSAQEGGCSCTGSTNVPIIAKPTATASSNSPLCEGATIRLTGGPDGMTGYNWYGPGGWTSYLQNPTRPGATTAMSGNYSLSVANSGCVSDNVTISVTVNLSTIADFYAAPLSGFAPLTVNFTDTSTGNPSSRAWDFDNNGTVDSIEQNPVYQYLTAGTYSVKLSVTNAFGCSDNKTRIGYIIVSIAPTPPIVAIEICTDPLCIIPAFSMTPQTTYYAKVSVTSNTNLSYLQTVQVILFYNDGSHPDAPSSGNTQTCAILTCTVGPPSIWVSDFGSPPSPTTTWQLVNGLCSQPADLNVPTGDWIFAFVPGKVATESINPAHWDAQGKATNKSSQSGDQYVRNKAMNWYGEITINSPPLGVDWDEVPLGLKFQDAPNPKTVSTTYIANGDYFEDIMSSDNWTGDGQTVMLDVSGVDPAPAGMFALKADNTLNYDPFNVVKSTEVRHINASGSQTSEAGVLVDTNGLWLSIGEADINPVTYSGAIYYQISDR